MNMLHLLHYSKPLQALNVLDIKKNLTLIITYPFTLLYNDYTQNGQAVVYDATAD